MTAGVRPYIVGVSLKMYFTHAHTVEWCRTVASFVEDESLSCGDVELFVLPTYLSIPAAREILGERIAVGAQDIASEDSGAFTGEVSGVELAELGCRIAEVGHAERRARFGDTDAVVRAKTSAAYRTGLTPLLCVGEMEFVPPEQAADQCIAQIEDALMHARAAGPLAPLLVAYEPWWAIGAPRPAPVEHITAVCARVKEHLASCGVEDSALLYGGSAGVGLATRLGKSVDGMFLGRFAHDAADLRLILGEVRKLRRTHHRV